MLSILKSWLQYWKASLSDSQKLSIDLDKVDKVNLPFENIEKGILPSQSIQSLFTKEEKRINEENGVKNSDDKGWKSIQEINVLISLLTVSLIPEHLQFAGDSKPIYPFWISASVNREGSLKVPENYFPFVPRDYLFPTSNNDVYFTFSTVDKVDEAAAVHKEDIKNWSEFTDYIKHIFHALTSLNINEYSEEGYLIKRELTVIVQDERFVAAESIIKLYTHLLKTENLPKLLERLISIESPQNIVPFNVESYLESNINHLGQMGDSFPLSITQRRSLYNFIQSTPSSVFAVNGPPGTGKTTLLQSVVANLIVKHAIEGGEPPVILACSTNNQAVTNIIESFISADSSLNELNGRWIPSFSGYATYLPSNKKDDSELKGKNYLKLDNAGTLEAINNLAYVKEAKAYFFQKSNAYLKSNFLHLKEVTESLQNELKDIQNELSKSTALWVKLVKQKQSILALTHQDKINAEEINFWAQLKNEVKSLESEVTIYYQSEPIIRQIFCFFKFQFALNKRKLEVKKIVRESVLLFENPHFTSEFKIKEYFNSIITQVIELQNTIKLWDKWKSANNIKYDPINSEEEMWSKEYEKLRSGNYAPSYFYDELDISLRHKAFQLAIHYWEGRWLMSKETDFHENISYGRGEKDCKLVWKQRAMLTPCFVSTLFMAPKFFTWAKHLGKRNNGTDMWENPPLFNFIDLLIIDESGQVSPEVGVAIFSLAKKAIVVGDVKQIEPVWSITGKIDIGNLSKFQLANKNNNVAINLYHNKGFLSSSGNIMKMAQNACEFVDPENKLKERGLLLTEHRRCNNEIIEYCNELAYAGMLKPMKGNAKPNQLFPSMALIHVEGNSTVKNKDRFNELEADFITKWVLQNKSGIEKRFANPEKNKYPNIEELVGIITPFKGQKRILQQKFSKAGFKVSAMKIGTVHALQGSEREIVIFSPVYGESDTGTMFFDRDNKPNMLNVAVSRAKQSFIVIGNEKIFNPKLSTPSGILRKYLIKM